MKVLEHESPRLACGHAIIIPIMFEGINAKSTRRAVMCFSWVFHQMCMKVVDPNKMHKLKKDVVITLCMLEMEMPPFFFDFMKHLVLHLVEKLELCEPMNIKWMYCIERMNKVMKRYVRCMKRPKGCMVEGYMMDESLGLLIKYL
jgi:hypothetical protein